MNPDIQDTTKYVKFQKYSIEPLTITESLNHENKTPKQYFNKNTIN
jgi:hypothetical protein